MERAPIHVLFDEIAARRARFAHRIRRAFVVTLLGSCLASFVGGLGVFVYLGFFADASVSVFHGGGTAQVFLDGHRVATFAAPVGDSLGGEVRRLRVPRGPHQLRIEHDNTARTSNIDANGLDDLLFPTDPATCFATIEVSRVVYDAEGALILPAPNDPCAFDADRARITCVHTHFPHAVESSVLRIEDLPKRKPRLAFLLVPFACADASTVEATSLMRRFLGCPTVAPNSEL